VFKSIDKREICSVKSFKVTEEKILLPSGKESTHLTLEHPGAVVILPKLDNNTVIMIRQYRHSIRRVIFELPAGTLNLKEDPLFCAKRELQEEVNYKAQSWRSLGTLYPAPGFCDEVQHLFLAEGLSEAKGTLDEDELIEICPLSLNQISKLARDNEIVDGKTLACLYRAQLIG